MGLAENIAYSNAESAYAVALSQAYAEAQIDALNRGYQGALDFPTIQRRALVIAGLSSIPVAPADYTPPGQQTGPVPFPPTLPPPGTPPPTESAIPKQTAPATTPPPLTLPTGSVLPSSGPNQTSSASSAAGTLQAQYIGGGQIGLGDYCDEYPDDPYCQLYGGLGGIFGGIPTGGSGPVTTTINVASGLIASDVHNIVNNALNGLWGVVVGALDLALGGAIKSIQQAVTALGNALKEAWNVLNRLHGLTLQFLGTLWGWVVAGLVRSVHTIISALKDLYTNILVPLAKLAQTIRDKLLKIWTRFIVPVLNWIQDIRKVLQILAIFHVKFAQKLDTQLADIERRITQPFLIILGGLNQIANYMNLILTARYLFQKPTFLNSLQSYVGESINLQINAMAHTIGAADVAAAQKAAAFTPAAQSQADFVQLLSTGSGGLATTVQQQSTALDTILKAKA